MDQSSTKSLALPILWISDSKGDSWGAALAGDVCVVGRSPDANVVLPSHRVSRQHVELRCDASGQWSAHDLGSRNGTRVNTESISTVPLKNGDLIQIADFVLQLRIAPGWERHANSTGTRPTDTSVALIDTSAAHISALTGTRPKLDAAHLETLTAFGHELYDLDDPKARLESLCHLMIQPGFQGQSASVLRLQEDDDDQIHVLAQARSLFALTKPIAPVSRTVTRAMREHAAPVLASNVDTDEPSDGALQLSMSPDVEQMCVIACPLAMSIATGASATGPMDLLYVTFPSQCATTEWLALVALAAKQYEFANSDWEKRIHAREAAWMKAELERAHKLQMRLVPKEPTFEGLDVAIYFRPCRWVGGDYVDTVEMPDGKVLLTVADVSGKGMQAALVSTGLHTMVHAGLRAGQGLEQMMEELDRYLCETLPARSFVTMVAIVLDPATGEMQCINAGHPPVFIMDETSLAPMQQAENFPLGIAPQSFTAQTSQLQPGQLLAMYSDGLTESRDVDGEQVGIERLGQRLATLHRGTSDLTSEQTAAAISGWLDDLHQDHEPEDDMTYLLARRQ